MQLFTRHLEFEEVTVMKSKTTLLTLATLALILMVGIPTTQAQSDKNIAADDFAKPGTLVLRVEVDFSTFDLTPSPGGDFCPRAGDVRRLHRGFAKHHRHVRTSMSTIPRNLVLSEEGG